MVQEWFEVHKNKNLKWFSHQIIKASLDKLVQIMESPPHNLKDLLLTAP